MFAAAIFHRKKKNLADRSAALDSRPTGWSLNANYMGNEGEKLLGGNCRLHGTTDAVDQWFRTTGNSVVRLIVVSVPAAWHRRAVSQGHGSDIKHSKNAAGDGRKTGCLIAV